MKDNYSWLDSLLIDFYWACEYNGTSGHKTEQEVKQTIISQIRKERAEAIESFKKVLKLEAKLNETEVKDETK